MTTLTDEQQYFLNSALRAGRITSKEEVIRIKNVIEHIERTEHPGFYYKDHLAYMAEAVQYGGLAGLRETSNGDETLQITKRANQILKALEVSAS